MISLKSQITQKVLNYFFINPTAKCYINELAKILKVDPKNLLRKLNELEKEGLLISEFSGRQKYYYLNKSFSFLKLYKEMFLKTLGIENILKKIVNSDSKIIEAYIFGSYANNKMDKISDIDLLIIGKHSSIDIINKINKIQKEIGREINIINLSPEEFKKKKQTDNLLINIFLNKIIRLK
jgi:predicted nucleotidyltransferase